MNTVFRPKGNLVWAGLAFVLDAIFLTQSIFYPTGAGIFVLDLAVAIFVAAAAYLLWVKPKLVLRENDLVVVNPFKKATIQYSTITELKTKWALQIHYSDTSIQVWVAPANGKGRWIADSTFRWRNNRVPLTEGKTIEHSSMSQSLGSDSGLAASLIRERMNH
jgi:hypothetical protein